MRVGHLLGDIELGQLGAQFVHIGLEFRHETQGVGEDSAAVTSPGE